MAKMVSSVVIARPVAKVFEFFLDLDVNASKVDPTAGSVVKTPAGPTGPGTTFQFRRQSLGRTRETHDPLHGGRTQPQDRVRG